MASAAIEVNSVSKRFRLYHERNQSLKAALMRGKRAQYEDFWALRDVSFEIPQGSTFGLIGENGSGKSTLLKVIAGIYQANSGDVRTKGSLAALLELGSGFHPELSGRENVYLNGSILGMKKNEIAARFDDIVDFAGIEQFIDQPVKNYSSGMYVRLGFSVAINVDPDILLVDEVLAVGDSAFQEKCLEKFAAFRRAGKTVVIVSHAMGSLRTMCDQAAWLRNGKLIEVGQANEVVVDYIDETHNDTQPVGDNGSRWGSGEVRVEAVEVFDEAGRPAPRLHSGQSVTIRLGYNARTRIQDPVFGLGIEAADGRTLWGSNTREAGLSIDFIEGPGTIEFTIPSLPLQGESFDLVSAITDQSTTHIYDFLRGCVRLDVDSARPAESGGPVSLSGRWSSVRSGDRPAHRPFAVSSDFTD